MCSLAIQMCFACFRCGVAVVFCFVPFYYYFKLFRIYTLHIVVAQHSVGSLSAHFTCSPSRVHCTTRFSIISRVYVCFDSSHEFMSQVAYRQHSPFHFKHLTIARWCCRLPSLLLLLMSLLLINMSHKTKTKREQENAKNAKLPLLRGASVVPLIYPLCSHLIRKINIDNEISVVSSLLICKFYGMQKRNHELEQQRQQKI